MANKKSQQVKAKTASPRVDAGTVWLAGVGAVSLARKQADVLLGRLVAEGRRLQGETMQTVREAQADARAQVAGLLSALQIRAREQAAKAGDAFETRVGHVLARLGIASKTDIAELAQRVGALSRQLKSAK